MSISQKVVDDAIASRTPRHVSAFHCFQNRYSVVQLFTSSDLVSASRLNHSYECVECGLSRARLFHAHYVSALHGRSAPFSSEPPGAFNHLLEL